MVIPESTEAKIQRTGLSSRKIPFVFISVLSENPRRALKARLDAPEKTSDGKIRRLLAIVFRSFY